ncbi:MAG: TRAP transporter large permease subunit [Chloroflexota bacterium]
MCFTVISVIMRYFFNRPVPGDNEITELLIVVAVFFGAVAVAQINKRHVMIEIGLEALRDRGRVVMNSVVTFFGIGLFLILIWRTAITASLYMEQGNSTRMLAIPLSPFAWIIPLGCFLVLVVLLRDLSAYLNEGTKLRLNKGHWLLIFGLPVLLLALIVLFLQGGWEINSLLLGVVGLLFCVLLFFTGMPVTFAMFVTGFLGMSYLRGIDSALSFLGGSLWQNTANYAFAVVPLFVTMGYFVFYSDISRDLYNTAYRWLGRMSGGLSVATITACTGYAAVVGDVFTGTITMGAVALPEMKRYKYDNRLSTGSICAGSTLGSLIPPSVPFVIYAIITQQSVADMFMAGVFPGLLMGLSWVLYIYIRCRMNPTMGPPGPSTSFREKMVSLRATWSVGVLFIMVLGGIYLGVFTPTEAGGIGAAGALIIGVALRRYSWKSFGKALAESSELVAMIFLMLAGAAILSTFFVLSKFPLSLANYLAGLTVSPILIIIAISLVLLILGCLVSSMALLLVVVPILFPVITHLGFDPIWFGVLVVMLFNIGALTPPFAINVFALRGVARDIPIGTMYRGVLPFVLVALVSVALVMVFPGIATWLPGMMK